MRLGPVDVVVRRRQSLYEYCFFGDPVRMAGALVGSYEREPHRERVRAFLARRRRLNA